ncbi:MULTISPECIES: YaaR family protein [Terribacillus]|uniref:YaaR family protein n=1 Tax=Terribacillus TaxID=459532 RepID=UPI00098495C7|nr:MULTISPECIES: YaaR family protein [Terribacillus]QXE01768.1 YaaR family protein [Terribacillus sp. DMT04]
MKIGPEIRAQLDAARKNTTQTPTEPRRFQDLVQSQSRKLQGAELQQLITDITKQGERLAKTRSFRELTLYKRKIKKFMEDVKENGMELHHEHSWNQNGARRLTTVRQIDEKLMELTEILMDQEKQQIGVLGLIGEIKGLLFNLYT